MMRTHATPGKTSIPIAGLRPARLPVRRVLSALRAQRLEVGRILGGPRLQPKLTIGPPDDVFEREADRVADEVTRLPAAARSGEPLQRTCPECEEEQVQRQPLEEEEEELMPKAAGTPCCQGEPDYAERVRRVREESGGRPLTGEERGFFEPRFGRDFAHVRLHDNPLADTAARAVSARAYTLGSDVVFRAGAYRPGTADGRHLLAHELTHVVQQTPTASSGLLQRQDPEGAQPPAAAAPAQQPAVCPVQPLTAITDAEALLMEGGQRIVWPNDGGTLQNASNALIGAIQGAGGTATLTSAYRPQAYQDHLREVWDRARELQNHPGPECDVIRAAVTAEMTNHQLAVDRPVAQVSRHRLGNAVDIAWTLPAGVTLQQCGLPLPEGVQAPGPAAGEEPCIDSLATGAGMVHNLHAADRPHFVLP